MRIKRERERVLCIRIGLCVVEREGRHNGIFFSFVVCVVGCEQVGDRLFT